MTTAHAIALIFPLKDWIKPRANQESLTVLNIEDARKRLTYRSHVNEIAKKSRRQEFVYLHNASSPWRCHRNEKKTKKTQQRGGETAIDLICICYDSKVTAWQAVGRMSCSMLKNSNHCIWTAFLALNFVLGSQSGKKKNILPLLFFLPAWVYSRLMAKAFVL